MPDGIAVLKRVIRRGPRTVSKQFRVRKTPSNLYNCYVKRRRGNVAFMAGANATHIDRTDFEVRHVGHSFAPTLNAARLEEEAEGCLRHQFMSDLQQASHATEVLPTCTKCRAPMALKRLRAGKSFYYVGKFECETCGRTVTKAVKLRLASGPPIAPTS